MGHFLTNTIYCSITLIVFPVLGDIASESVGNRNKIFDEKLFVSYDHPLANSPPLARNLAENEQLIYAEIKSFYSSYVHEGNHFFPQSAECFKCIHNYLTNFELTTGQLSLKLNRNKEDINDHYGLYKTIWNPLASFLMFQRFVKTLKQIVRDLDTNIYGELALQKQILSIMQSTGWPKEEDLVETIRAVLRIQHVYDLNTYDLSRGKIWNYETNVSLSIEDCVEIGKQAMNESHYALAVEWFEVAQLLTQTDNRNHNISPQSHNTTISHLFGANTLKDYIQHSQEVHDEKSNSSEPWDPMFFATPCQNEVSRVRRRTTQFQHWKGGQTSNLNDINYWGTCSGENYKTESEKSKLFCWYETKMNYFLRINPLKAELLSINPLLIIQYYDIIGDNMIEKIKQNATSSLAKSRTLNHDRFTSSVRSSLNSWIDDHNEKALQPISKTIEATTGLRVSSDSSCEMLQVAAYTTGSHYVTHIDAFHEERPITLIEEKGNRIATFIYYLNEVEMGGGTSFPQSGIASVPIKGSAVLWFSLLRNGEIDENSHHGACPVVIGEKWISNKWIRSKDQMFLEDYKCVPDQNSTFSLKINGKDLMELLEQRL